MTRRPFICMVLVLLPLVLASCPGEAPQEQPFPIKKAPAPAPAPEAAEATTPGAAPQETLSLKRNPFLSYIVEKGVTEEKRIKGPLECCELSLFRLVAVISGIEQPKAMVQAPDNKKYVVKVGDRIGINDGRIVSIGVSSITVREPVKNEVGDVISTNDVVIKLPKDEGKKG